MMSARDDATSVRMFAIAQAAQRFLLDALPLREPETTIAACAFCQVLPSAGVERVAAEAIVVTVIRKLGARSGIGADVLLNGYFLHDASVALPDRFRQCMTDLLGSRGVRHPAVAEALRLVDARCADPRLRLEGLARELHVSGSHLAHLISLHTGERFRTHVRHARMRIAVKALRASSNIQEVATTAGYRHVADFNHHFKREFGVTPTVFRARLVAAGSLARTRLHDAVEAKKPMARASIAASSPTVLIVEDDLVTCHTFGLFLRDAGYVVETVESLDAGRAAVQRLQPAVILVDRWVGQADGIAFTCEVARASMTRRVALVTGDVSLDDEAMTVLNASGVRIVFKPLDLEDLLDLVRSLAGRPAASNVHTSGAAIDPRGGERLRVSAKS